MRHSSRIAAVVGLFLSFYLLSNIVWNEQPPVHGKVPRIVSNHETDPAAQARFENATTSLGIPADVKADQTTVYDFNGDGYPDLFFLSWYFDPGSARAFLNMQGKKFREIPVDGLVLPTRSMVKFAPDIFGEKRLGAIWRKGMDEKTGQKFPLIGYHVDLVNDRLVFSAIPADEMPDTLSNFGDVQFFDYDQDGLLDMVIGGHYTSANSMRADPVYLFQGTGKSRGWFKNRSGDAGFSIPAAAERVATDVRSWGPNISIGLCDFDNDGNLDVLVPSYGRRWNRIWRRVSGRTDRFEEVGARYGFYGDSNGLSDYRGNGNSFIPLCGDILNRGRMDVFQGEITHLWAGPTSDLSSILWNEYPKPFERFTSLPREAIQSDRGDIGAAMGDLALRGKQDLIIASCGYPPETKFEMFRFESKRDIKNVTSELGEEFISPEGLVAVDLDRDGDLEIVSGSSPFRGNTKPYVRIYRNLTREKDPSTRFISLELEGDGEDVSRAPIGARVTLDNAGPQVRELTFGAGADAASVLVAHFGIPTTFTEAKVQVSIRWPNGQIQKASLDLNRNYKIVYKKQSNPESRRRGR